MGTGYFLSTTLEDITLLTSAALKMSSASVYRYTAGSLALTPQG